jgi:hypothetical protein
MMKRLLAHVALISGLVVQPAMAQVEPVKPAVSADADLLCALWAADMASRAKTEKEKYSLTLLMTYFMGRWEGASGRSIEDGFTMDFATAAIARMPEVTPDCLKRSGEFGQKLQLVGKSLQDADKAK